MEPLLGHYGVQVNRDLLVDRVNNGRMTFPIRYGETVRPVQLNYPLIPKLTQVNDNAQLSKGLIRCWRHLLHLWQYRSSHLQR